MRTRFTSPRRQGDLAARFAVRIGWAATLCLVHACSIPTEPGDSLDGSATDFTFEADVDPAVAALDYEANELLVQPYPGAEAAAIETAYADAGATVLDEDEELDLAVLSVGAGRLNAAAAKLSESGLFETIQKNYLYLPEATPDDPLYARQTYLSRVGVPEAWNTTTGRSDIVIAVVDTGVSPNHVDLSSKLLDGWNVYDGNSTFDDVLGHGTMVAGIAAASGDNAEGVSGVSWTSPILPVRVGNADGLSSGRHIAAGILWAAGQGAKVINVSFAPLWSDRIVKAAAQTAFNRGSLVIISAGNGGGLTTASGYDEAVFVGAVSDVDEIASFSDRGPFVDVVAPGTGIRSTEMDGGYGMNNGTSFAAPIVSGVAALIWSVNPDLRPATVAKAILSTAVDLGDAGRDLAYGEGLVDAAASVEEALVAPADADTTTPVARIVQPLNGTTISGKTIVTAQATDASGVADVVLSVDGIPFATDTRSAYAFVLDTAAFSAGEHALSVAATDVVGNESAASNVVVRFAAATSVNGRGSITFSSPRDGSTVTGDVTIKATVSDPDGLAVIEWLVDGDTAFTTYLTGTSSGVSYRWSASAAPRGQHEIAVFITDVNGQQSFGSITLTR